MWTCVMKWTHIALHETSRGFQVTQRCAVMAGIMLFQAVEVEGLGAHSGPTVRKEKLRSEALPGLASVL